MSSSSPGNAEGEKETPHIDDGSPSRYCDTLTRKTLQLSLDQAHEEARAEGQDLVVEIVSRIMDRAPAFAVAVADHHVRAGTDVEHEGEILRCHDQRTVAIDVLLAD